MPKIKIIISNDAQATRFELVDLPPAIIPCDGCFHMIDDRLLGVVEGSDVEVEILEDNGDDPDADENTDAPDKVAASVEGAEGLGGSSAPSSPAETETADSLSQLDRDGNGEPGGSLPGNKTAPAAKGKRKKK